MPGAESVRAQLHTLHGLRPELGYRDEGVDAMLPPEGALGLVLVKEPMTVENLNSRP
jgi:hypothetical protein